MLTIETAKNFLSLDKKIESLETIKTRLKKNQGLAKQYPTTLRITVAGLHTVEITDLPQGHVDRLFQSLINFKASQIESLTKELNLLK